MDINNPILIRLRQYSSSLQDIYLKRCKSRAAKIIKDSNHPGNRFFHSAAIWQALQEHDGKNWETEEELLPSGHQAPKLSIITSTGLNLINCKTFIILHHPHCCYVYIPGTTCFAHSSCTSLFILIFIKSKVDCIAHLILFHCTFYSLFYFILSYFIFFSYFLSYSYLFFILLLPIFIYILLCYVSFLFFIFLHCPLSGPVLTYISLLIIPCMIVYVTNNKEPWTYSD